MVYAGDLKSPICKDVRVRVPPAPLRDYLANCGRVALGSVAVDRGIVIGRKNHYGSRSDHHGDGETQWPRSISMGCRRAT